MGQNSQLTEVILNLDVKALIARSMNYWSKNKDQDIYLSWQKTPKAGRIISLDGGAHAWVCEENGRPTDEEPKAKHFSDMGLDKDSNGFFVWDEGGQPMQLIAMPPSVPLLDAKPEPSGVWEADGKICAFWQAPSNERKVAFRLGDPIESLEGNVKYWRDRLSPRKKEGPLAHPIITGLVVIGLTIAISVILVVFFGQAAAAAWVGAGGTVIALVSSFILPQLHSRPPKAFKSKPLSNP